MASSISVNGSNTTFTYTVTTTTTKMNNVLSYAAKSLHLKGYGGVTLGNNETIEDLTNAEKLLIINDFIEKSILEEAANRRIEEEKAIAKQTALNDINSNLNF